VRWSVLLAFLLGCDTLFSVDKVELDASHADGVYTKGCADGTREGFLDTNMWPALAACAGAWSVAGLRPEPEVACKRAAGNTGMNAAGAGCSATDLCADGWHVCRTSVEVMSASDTGCAGIGALDSSFFATAQSGPGAGECDAVGTNDLFGCGTYGASVQPSCAPLDRTSSNQCSTIAVVGGWMCPSTQSEITVVAKTDPTAGGGVLCCRDVL
jgi:hypothetical protein